ncbi:MAG TPA: toll/interleukin-1 receptor domain-containing protein [Thermoanaerobaculia bacterium]|nr:toll/interleukin-1 receptor domain-containing protein [Thermoanaerobaculia bacterium]
MAAPLFLLSYSRKDAIFAKEVRECLEAVGLRVLMDELNMVPGQAVSEALRELVRSATHLVVIVSRESLKSEWVLFELGIAWALRREIWCLLAELNLKPPAPVGHLKYLQNLAELKNEAARMLFVSRAREYDKMGSVENFASNSLFRDIPEIRLVGAGDRFYNISRVQIVYDNDPFNPPVALYGHMKKILAKKEAETKARGAVFFNGPNVRLLDWRENPMSGVDSTLERYSIELRLGPVSWFDFEGLNAAFRELVGEPGLLEACEEYLSLSKIVDEGSVRGSKLSNILDTATTILTSDGFCGYQARSSRISAVPKLLTSSVAENINRYLDEMLRVLCHS